MKKTGLQIAITFMIRLFILLVCMTCTHLLSAQPNDTTLRIHSENQFSLLTSAGFSRSAFVEVGFAYNSFSLTGHHPFAANFYISNELHFRDRLTIAPKAGLWFSGGSGGIVFGSSLLYYTDLGSGSFVFRPEIGIGVRGVKVTYGYNKKISNEEFKSVSTNVVQLTGSFKLLLLKKIHSP